MKPWQWNAYQLRAFAAAGACDVLVQAGGRGSSKSTASFGLLLRTAQSCPGSRSLLLRTTEQAISDPWNRFKTFLARVGVVFTANEGAGEVRIGSSVVVFGVCESLEQYERSHRGHEYVVVCISEFCSFRSVDVPLKFFENLRSPDYKTLYVLETNPGPLGFWVQATALDPAKKLPPGTPWECPELGGRTVIALTSSLEDNPAIDGRAYNANLVAAAQGSDIHYRRERFGEFGLVKGALWPARRCHLVRMPVPSDWREYPHIKVVAGGDHGSRSIFCIAIAINFTESGIAPNGEWFSKGSYVLVGEATSAAAPAFIKAEYEASVEDICMAYLKECERLNLREAPLLYLDNQITQRLGNSPLIDEYRKYVRVEPIRKGRIVDGVRRVRELMMHAQPPVLERTQSLLAALGAKSPGVYATNPRQLPGLYWDSRQVPYLHYCITNLPASQVDPDMPDPRSPLDHGADALRYLLESTGTALTGSTGLPPPLSSQAYASIHVAANGGHAIIPSDKILRRELAKGRGRTVYGRNHPLSQQQRPRR